LSAERWPARAITPRLLLWARYGYYATARLRRDDYYGGCVWQRQRFWDGYGWRFRRVRVCG